jgi:hypothetical protein
MPCGRSLARVSLLPKTWLPATSAGMT